ncbi:MAG: M81 family metallopeptidase [Spirochaetaceae bacterium]|nr:MAG: M81 family metallopeptidase [Spirochaetaceae bacterium]
MRRSRFFGVLVCFFVFVWVLTGCISDGRKRAPSAPRERYRIAVAQVAQETNSFSPVPTTMRDFEALGLYRGDEIEQLAREYRWFTLGGFWAAVEKLGKDQVDIVPIVSATAMSGGPVQKAVYEALKADLLEGLWNAGILDGVYLCLHGAMGVQGMHDPDGDLIAAVRRIVGPEVPIGVSFDLHANITRTKVENATFIVGYKTNPHRDFYKTGYTCGKLLLQCVRGEIRPTMEYVKMRLLKGGGMTIDFLAPMRDIFKTMDRMEKDRRVLSVSNFMVQIWLDDPQLGWATVAVTDDDPQLARETAEHLAELNWSVRDVEHPIGISPSEAVAIANKKKLARLFGTIVICDVSDAVGAGAPGESTWILKALLQENPELVSYVPVRDQEAACTACRAPLHDTITLSVGGKLDAAYNRPLTVRGEVIYQEEGQLGKTAILRCQGVHLILTELPAMTYRPTFFTDFGLNLRKADVVVVKNIFPFRFTYMRYNCKTLDVITPGTTNVDVFALRYENLPRPIYPLDDIEGWR